jgi:hypothetical protein
MSKHGCGDGGLVYTSAVSLDSGFEPTIKTEIIKKVGL